VLPRPAAGGWSCRTRRPTVSKPRPRNSELVGHARSMASRGTLCRWRRLSGTAARSGSSDTPAHARCRYCTGHRTPQGRSRHGPGQRHGQTSFRLAQSNTGCRQPPASGRSRRCQMPLGAIATATGQQPDVAPAVSHYASCKMRVATCNYWVRPNALAPDYLVRWMCSPTRCRTAPGRVHGLPATGPTPHVGIFLDPIGDLIPLTATGAVEAALERWARGERR
jgi:hypothetical protein